MASTSASMEIDVEQPHEVDGHFIRVIVADTQAIFRAGLRKIFALEDDIRVVGQSETLSQTLSAAKKFTADILIFEASLTPNPVEAVSDLIRQTPNLRLVVVTPESNQELTLELLRRGVHGVVGRDVEPELLVECLRKVSEGHPWLDSRGTQWVLEAFRTQGYTAHVPAPQGAADSEGIAHRLLRNPGNEEQGNRTACRYDRAGGQELSAQGIRQAGRGGSPGTRVVLPAQPRPRRKRKSPGRSGAVIGKWQRPGLGPRKHRNCHQAFLIFAPLILCVT